MKNIINTLVVFLLISFSANSQCGNNEYFYIGDIVAEECCTWLNTCSTMGEAGGLIAVVNNFCDISPLDGNPDFKYPLIVEYFLIGEGVQYIDTVPDPFISGGGGFSNGGGLPDGDYIITVTDDSWPENTYILDYTLSCCVDNTLIAPDSNSDGIIDNDDFLCPSDTPVCGCDGNYYNSACEALNWYGVMSWEAAIPGTDCFCDINVDATVIDCSGGELNGKIFLTATNPLHTHIIGQITQETL